MKLLLTHSQRTMVDDWKIEVDKEMDLSVPY
jgi:hypothetical protein